MKDIKEKVRDQSPKIRNPASRLPKELVRSAMLETKEKTSIMADKLGRETGEESPVEYAGNRIQRVEQRAGRKVLRRSIVAVKKLAVKTYEKIKEQKQKREKPRQPRWERKMQEVTHLPRQGRQWQRKGEQKPQGALRSSRK